MKEKVTIYDFSRICKTYYDNCSECPLAHQNNGISVRCDDILRINPDKANEIILNWITSHPVKTKQDNFLKLFPNATQDNGIIDICPLDIDKTLNIDCKNISCLDCQEKYWSSEGKLKKEEIKKPLGTCIKYWRLMTDNDR